ERRFQEFVDSPGARAKGVESGPEKENARRTARRASPYRGRVGAWRKKGRAGPVTRGGFQYAAGSEAHDGCTLTRKESPSRRFRPFRWVGRSSVLTGECTRGDDLRAVRGFFHFFPENPHRVQ